VVAASASSGNQRRLLVLWSSLILAVGALPLCYGYLSQSDSAEFVGVTFNIGDVNQYLAWVEQSRRGHWLFDDPYTLEDHQRVFFHPFLLILGKLSALTGLSPTVCYHLSHLLGAILLLWACYRFVTHFLDEPLARGLAFVIVTTASGLSWLEWLESSLGVKFHFLFSATFRAASSTFWSLYLYPLFSISIALLLLCVLAFQRFLATGALRHALNSGLLLLLLVTLHAYDLMIVLPVLLGQILLLMIHRRRVEWRWFLGYALTAACSAPYLLYIRLLLLGDPVFAEVGERGIHLPSPMEFVGMFGFLLPLAALQIPRLLREQSPRSTLLLVWLTAIPLLTYLPLGVANVPARLIEGYHVVLSVLSAATLYPLAAGRRPWRRAGLVLLLLLLTLGNAWVMTRDLETLAGHPFPRYLDRDIASALQWLSAQEPSSAVLASYKLASFVPARTHHRVYAGHLYLTLDLGRKLAVLDRFFDAKTSDSARARLMREQRIRYLIHSPLEARKGRYRPEKSRFLRLVFESGRTRIFELKR
jgi:hypothetical protein